MSMPLEVYEQANIYINAIAEVAHKNSAASQPAMLACDSKRANEHERFTDLCRRHGVRLADREAYTRYAFELSGRKLFERSF